VILNKIDKPAANPHKAHEEVFELFMDLGATDEQLDFTTVYAIAKNGVAKRYLTDEDKDIFPLLDIILEKVPAAQTDASAPLRCQVFNLAYDNFLGRIAIARIYEGTLKAAANLVVKKIDGTSETGRVTKLFTFQGLERKETDEAVAGDIVMIAGFPKIDIGETLCLNAEQIALPAITVDEPTISLDFLVNNSPLAGREGKYVTSKQIKERLEKELEVNVGMKIDFTGEFFKVYSRGELHAAILIETMRREGYELQVSQPKVIIEIRDGKKFEPYEEVTIDVPEASSGIVMEKMGKRKGIITSMKNTNGQMRLVFEMPTRGLLGYRGEFTIDTRGEGILCSRVLDYRPYAG
jgi:GTP-binding protein